MKTKAAPSFIKESDLCAAFTQAVARDLDWTAFNETAGFDILLVRKDGIQIGIEAKLKLNAKVVTQALPRWLGVEYGAIGPHYRAVLVPVGEINITFHRSAALSASRLSNRTACAVICLTIFGRHSLTDVGKMKIGMNGVRRGHARYRPTSQTAVPGTRRRSR